MMGPGEWYGMMFLGPLMMILFLAAIVVLVVLGVRWLGGSRLGGTPGPSPNKALDILKERFARGEIDKDEFELRRRALSE
jgi:putative membrane protein